MFVCSDLHLKAIAVVAAAVQPRCICIQFGRRDLIRIGELLRYLEGIACPVHFATGQLELKVIRRTCWAVVRHWLVAGEKISQLR